MKLYLANVGAYMLSAGLLPVRELAASQARIRDCSACHNVFVVQLERQALVIKQPRRLQPARGQLRNEATLNWLIANQPPFTSLQPYAPRYLLYDAQLDILAVDSRPGYGNIYQFDAADPLLPARLGAWAALLRLVHAITPASIAEPQTLALLGQSPPDVLCMFDLADPRCQHYSTLAPELFARIAGLAGVPQLLVQLRARVRVEALVHRDIRLGNILTGPGGPTDCLLIDWDLAGLGDPLWDVACLLQSIADTVCVAPHALFERPFRAMAALLLQPYCAPAGGGLRALDAADYMLGKYVQTAFEHHNVAKVMNPAILRLLDFAQFLAAQREACAGMLAQAAAGYA